jgi:hypothetical protein
MVKIATFFLFSTQHYGTNGFYEESNAVREMVSSFFGGLCVGGGKG